MFISQCFITTPIIAFQSDTQSLPNLSPWQHSLDRQRFLKTVLRSDDLHFTAPFLHGRFPLAFRRIAVVGIIFHPRNADADAALVQTFQEDTFWREKPGNPASHKDDGFVDRFSRIGLPDLPEGVEQAFCDGVGRAGHKLVTESYAKRVINSFDTFCLGANHVN